MDKREKGHSKLIIACSDPAENFKFIEETLNQMAFLIGVEIAEPRLDHITFGWDRIRCSLLWILCNLYMRFEFSDTPQKKYQKYASRCASTGWQGSCISAYATDG